MIAHQNLIAASQRLVLSTRSNALNAYPIHLATEALNAAIYDCPFFSLNWRNYN